MPIVDALLILVAFGLTFAVIGRPLMRGHAEEHTRAHEAEVADLEAAKAARYREIREAEMDFRTGKLSEADWRAIDRELRAEAIEVLRKLDRLGIASGEPPAPGTAELHEAGGDAAAEAPAGEPAEEPAEQVGQPPAA